MGHKCGAGVGGDITYKPHVLHEPSQMVQVAQVSREERNVHSCWIPLLPREGRGENTASTASTRGSLSPRHPSTPQLHPACAVGSYMEVEQGNHLRNGTSPSPFPGTYSMPGCYGTYC